MLTACPKCGAHYALADEAMGRKGHCKECGRKFVVLPVEPGDAAGRGGFVGRWVRRRALALVVLGLTLAAACAVVATLWARGDLSQVFHGTGP